ncbi:hypothetical protein ABZ370_35795 [Streptomyces sp. NPDC005962]|uniref:hypothetical protein n=1 Tax=Streptomyces sp. NPDC005962 TaxID=3154466 RepID=UPI0034102A0F
MDALYGQEREFMEQFETLQSSIRKRRSTVAIAGPEAVVRSAGEFANEVRDFRNELMHGRFRGHPFNQKHRLEGRLDAFAKAARTALEDEGHSPEGPAWSGSD